MTQLWRKGVAGAVTAASLAAMVVASSVPAEAGWRGHRGGGGRGGAVAAGIIGGLALGALAGAARRSYAAPVYAEPVYPAPIYAEPVYAEPAYPVAPAYAAPVEGGYVYESGCHKEWRPVYGAEGNYIRDRKVTVCY